MKWIGCFMVFLGSLGLSALYVLEYQREMELLCELRDLLELMEGEIRYGRASLPECFLRAGRQRPTRMGQAFQRVGERALLNVHEDLKMALEAELWPGLKEFFSVKELSGYFDFLSPDGYAEEEMQRRALEKARRRIEARSEQKRGDMRGKCRVAWCLGITGGVFTILLLS